MDQTIKFDLQQIMSERDCQESNSGSGTNQDWGDRRTGGHLSVWAAIECLLFDPILIRDQQSPASQVSTAWYVRDTSNFSNIDINIEFINILSTATAQYKILLIDRIIWTNYIFFIYHCWCWKLSKFWRTDVLRAGRRCMVQHMQKITDYRHFIVFRGPLGGEENFLQLLGLDRGPGQRF